MERILTQQVKEKIRQQVKIAGFIHAIRDQGSIKFLIVRDISGMIQIVITKSNIEAMEIAKSLNLESVVEITGMAKEEKQVPNGFEITTGAQREHRYDVLIKQAKEKGLGLKLI